MRLCNYLTQQILIFILNFLRILTLADGARNYGVSSEEAKHAKAWSTTENKEPEPASHTLPAMETATATPAHISEDLVLLKLNDLLRETYRPSAQLPSQVPSCAPSEDPQSVGAGSEGGNTFCMGVGGARPKWPQKSFFTRASRIPIRSSVRSRSPTESPRSLSVSPTSVSPPFKSSVGPAARIFSTVFRRSSQEPENPHPDPAGISNPDTSAEKSGVTRTAKPRSRSTYLPTARRNRATGSPRNIIASKPYVTVKDYDVSRATSGEAKVPETSIAAARRSRSESGTTEASGSQYQTESFNVASQVGAGAEGREITGQGGIGHTTVLTQTGTTRVNVGPQSVVFPLGDPFGTSGEVSTGYSYVSPLPIWNEEFLLNNSIEQSFQGLFSLVTPELVNIARSLDTAPADMLSPRDMLTAQVVLNVIRQKKILIRPLGRIPRGSDEYMSVQATPEGILGSGGASIVFLVKLAVAPVQCAMKVHYNWLHENTVDSSPSALHRLTEARVTAASDCLSRKYSPVVLFSKFRFLAPLFSGEFSNVGPILLPHPTDRHKFLMNFVTIMPLMQGSFDMVLRANKLSPAAKRVICFSFVELVARLHLQMLVHGDLKPGNFFISQEGQVYLGDLDTVGLENSMRRCGAVTTVDYLDPIDAQCHIQSPNKLAPLTVARDSWSLGLSLFLVWCEAFPFPVLNQRSTLSLHAFVSRMQALTPDWTGGDSTTPKLDFRSCPGGMIADGLVLELIQRFLELDRNRRWTPIAGYEVILGAGTFAKKTECCALF